MASFKYAATCMFGLERFLGEEIDALGCKRTETIDGRVYFEGDENSLADANIRLRFAERVFINMGSFQAESFEELFEGTKALPWEMFVGKNDAFHPDPYAHCTCHFLYQTGDSEPFSRCLPVF